MTSAGGNVLVVPPFECSWLIGDEGRFAEPGKGCVTFEAMTENDITVVFKEHAVGKHYRTDIGPSYTVVLGSHRNRRFKIEVDGRTVVDVARVVLQPALFERYWINVYDGVITVGKGDPGKGVVYQWVDSKPNIKIQFVGLSSWDKHVGYRHIQVLPPLQHSKSDHLVDESGGLGRYLESEDLADVHIVVGSEGRTVPTHWLMLHLCCAKFHEFCSAPGEVVHLPLVQYPVLRAMLQYIYTGVTQILEQDLGILISVASEFGIEELVSQCEKLQNKPKSLSDERLKYDKGAGNFTIRYAEKLETTGAFLSQLPIDPLKLSQLYKNGTCSDVDLSVDGFDELVRAHRLILSAWSNPFAKMFTNGMRESKKDNVLIRDVCIEPFLVMIDFMYKGHFEPGIEEDSGSNLLSLLILADQFGVQLLQQKCVEVILENLSEDSASAVLLVAASMPNCQALCDRCVEVCAKHFDFCVALHAFEFRQLEFSCLQRILQHPDLRVTSEEKVLDAVLLWGANHDGISGWEDASAYFNDNTMEALVFDREEELKCLLPLIRFPFMSVTILQKLQSSNLCKFNQTLMELVLEALKYLEQDSLAASSQSNVAWHGRLVSFPKTSLRFTPRPSTYKELQYICDGDRNGVFHYIGTSYGLHPWMNPVLMKKITVTASSPPSRFTDSKTIVSGNFQGTSFAGPCTEDGRVSAWWKVDLGKNHQLMCNYYTIRQDGSANFIRSWSFQGSSDGVNWTELSSHKHEQTISRPGQYASWPVRGPSANLPFRLFRIMLCGPTTDISNPWNLCLCYMELYGYFQAFN
ncbi:hypothetical protein MPTK1_1g21560 [Marchantia polymorpha subsp. ruderalis]|uniref:BTB domain-containing protein n=4 Tax=Marchantia polymorpha TaxID=3197 RepID=A0AAF6ASR0_MARPO|nr:hypothetical protein MARPO_0001s0491 [Marchantia polymorpha]BBM99480.1 hypothetical protein Mp_1g21560 [Marchantia polymorpha subsp. ruderalis]|eukprot:PTQ50562.1 hypothetical protein MARPO_0001s0491 [Marchantia polymorpha]